MDSRIGMAELEPKARIEAVITPAAAIKVAEAFASGQAVMLEGYGGPWLITRMETFDQDGFGPPPVTRVWGVIAEDAAAIADARDYCEEMVPVTHCPFCGKIHTGPLPCRHCGEPDMPDADE